MKDKFKEKLEDHHQQRSVLLPPISLDSQCSMKSQATMNYSVCDWWISSEREAHSSQMLELLLMVDVPWEKQEVRS